MYHLWPNISDRSKLKRDHITYQCKGSVGVVGWGGGGAGPGVGIWHFSKIWRQIPRPQANHSSQMHQNFPELISFIRVATVREKSGKNENFSRSGKVREFCFLTQCIKVVNGPLKAKLNLSESFQPDGVFGFENTAYVYFDTAIYETFSRS